MDKFKGAGLCLGYSEIDKQAIATYRANFNCTEEAYLGNAVDALVKDLLEFLRI